MLHRLIAVFISLFVINASAAVANDEFPGRAKYPDVKVMTKSQLADKFNEVVVVDARSKLEFETLRIKGAINIPVAAKNFKQQVQDLRKATDKPIVFYCNGRTCYKSYKAARTAKFAKVKNVYAYDAGMFEWAKSYPQRAMLLGASPIKNSDIISKQEFSSRLLNPKVFTDKAFVLGKDSLILDVRDKYQRGATGFFPGKEQWASLDNRAQLDEYLLKAKAENKTLFIYDEVGKQVRWLHYALKKHDIKNYYFMEKGAKAYYKQMMKDMGI